MRLGICITWRLHSREVNFRLFVRFRKFICFLVEAEGLQSGGVEAARVGTGGVKSGEVEGESLLPFTLAIFLYFLRPIVNDYEYD